MVVAHRIQDGGYGVWKFNGAGPIGAKGQRHRSGRTRWYSGSRAMMAVSGAETLSPSLPNDGPRLVGSARNSPILACS